MKDTHLKNTETNSVLLYNKGGLTTASKIVVFTKTQEWSSYRRVRKYKFSYRSGNAFEEFQIEEYADSKLNHIADLRDLGIEPDRHAYNIMDEKPHKDRIQKIMTKGVEYLTNLLS